MSGNEGMYLDQLDAAQVAESLAADPILTANEDLEAALRPIVDSAEGRGVEDLKVVIVDRDPQGFTDLRNFAEEIVAESGGTVIVRSPFSVGTSSDAEPRAALELGQYEMMEEPNEYIEGFEAFVDEVGGYSVPLVDYSLLAGGAIVAVFAVLAVVWWMRSHGRQRPAGAAGGDARRSASLTSA
ncbi:hypothetical protein CJ204_01400 [Corynebacterium xerosis]|uniref:1-deoxy-D-xylulose-5-phosphate synthase n=1 Tax=Corynebacterium xerosis TaxID=1725 RepID=A0A2N6T1F3_9CORY|nr:DUF6676 family protein [Corynebacterium xerosis]PMC63147.1 hypothetical protein CJ204_01400 [Corynebacterium xerosis]